MKPGEAFLRLDATQTTDPVAAELAHVRSVLDAVVRVQSAAVSSETATAVAAFDVLLAELLRIGASDCGFIAEVRRGGDGAADLTTLAIADIARHEARCEFHDPHAALDARLDVFEPLVGTALKTRQAVIANAAAAAAAGDGREAGRSSPAAVAGVPIIHDEQPIGVIGLANRSGGYDDGWLERMKPLADTARTLLIARQARREQHRRERDLRSAAEETRRLAEVAALTSSAVVVADAAGCVEWVNAAFTRLTGHAIEDIRGRKPGSFLQGPDTDLATVRRIGECLRRGQGVPGTEILNYHKSGRPYWVLLEIQPVRDDTGRVVRFVSTESEVTELRDARERAEAAAGEAARLSSEMNAILELSPDGFVAFDASGRLTYSNPAFHRMTALEADRVRGIALEEFDRELAQRCDPGEFYVTSDQVADGALVRLVLIRPRAMTLQRVVRTLRDADGYLVGLMIYLRDVTEILASERALIAQQAKFAAAFHHSADYLSIVRSADQRFVDVNDAFERMTGYARAEAIGCSAADLRLWADPDQLAGALRELREKGAVGEVQARLRRRDGTVRQVIASAALIDIGAEPGEMWTVRDVTAQLAAVDALRASEAKFAAAFRNAADHMVISRLDNGEIIEVNDAFCRALGRARAEVLGCTVDELNVWADPAERDASMRVLLATGTVANHPFRQRRGDGAPAHCLLSASIVVIDGLRCVLSTARDISERVAAEESARQLTDRLRESVAALEEVNRHDALLSDMRDLLQTCHTPAEVRQIAAHFVPKLLAGSRGALYLINDSRTALEAGFCWNDEALGEAVFEPQSCWGLRRGRTYQVHDAHDPLVCGHVPAAPSGGYLCVPMAAQGETYGVLHVRYDGAPECDGLRRENRANFLRTMTEHVGLAMSNARLRENLRMQASRDALTGLLNRRFMEEAFERELSRCRRRDKPVAVLMIDIDHFKNFNDRHGHEAGDFVLKRVAATLAGNVRFEDIVCRYGGEEFLVILPEADQGVALARAGQARQCVAALLPEFGGTRLGRITISVGLAMFPRHGTTPEELVRRADEALYRAKREGRDRVVAADTGSE